MWETYEKRNRELDALESEAGQEKFQPVFFQRRYTIFRLPHLASRIVDFDDPRVQMPTGSIVHLLDDIVVPYDQRSDLPRFELQPILMRESFRKFILHTRELNLTGPIKREDKFILKWAGLPSILMRFRSRNGGKFKYPMSKLDLPTRLQTLIIVNHNPLTRIRMFGRLQYYRKVELILASVFNDVCELAKLQPEKTQYIFLPWGTEFYDRQLFLRSRKELTFSTIKRPESFQYILMMHILNYLYEGAETSIFSKIPDDIRSKINLVLYLNGKYVIFNLAIIKAMNEKNIAYIRFCNLLNMFSITGRINDESTPAERELVDKHFNIPKTVAEPEDGAPDDTPEAAKDEVKRQDDFAARVQKKLTSDGYSHPDVPTKIETVVPTAIGTTGAGIQEKAKDVSDLANNERLPLGGAHSSPHTPIDTPADSTDVADVDFDIPNLPDLPDLDLPDLPLDILVGATPGAADRAATIAEKAKVDAARTPDEKKEGFLAHAARKIKDMLAPKQAAYGVAGKIPEVSSDSQTQIRVNDSTESYTKDYTAQEDKAADAYIESLDTLTPKQMERYKTISRIYKKLTINDEPLEKILQKEYNVELDKSELGDNVVGSHPADPSVRFSALREYEKSYMHKSYKKQLVSTLTGFRRAGIYLVGLKAEHKRTPISNDMIYKCQYVDVRGKKSTITLRVPVVDEEGRILVDGIYKVLKKQRVDLPIVKISPTEVSLSSNYNKYRVIRNTAKAHDFFTYVDGLVNNPAKSTAEVVYGSSDINLPISRDYTEIAARYQSIKFVTQDQGHAVSLYFDYNNRFANADRSLQDEKKFYAAEEQFGVWIGKFGSGDLFIDVENRIHSVSKLQDEDVDFAYPTLPELLKQSLRPEETYDKMLTEWTVMKILDATLPVVFILAYRFGLRKVLDKIGLKYTITERRSKVVLGQGSGESFGAGSDEVIVGGSVLEPSDWIKSPTKEGEPGTEDIDTEDPNAVRYVPQPNDIAIKFADRTIWFNRYPLKQSLIAAGLDAFDLTNYELSQFESKEVYYQILMDIGKSINYLKGVDSFFDLFVDQMTYNVLRSMHEPTTADGLLVRATELLVTADHRPPSANANHRIRGYEQFNAIIYNEMSRQVANYQASRGRGNTFSVPPDAIYLRIVTNPSLVTVTSANPLQDIKESAELTHAGIGGRTEESFVINDRRYTKDDIGVMAPDTTDNGNVGMSAMLSLNPGITNTEGFTQPPEKLEPSNVLSAPVLTFPFATNDD